MAGAVLVGLELKSATSVSVVLVVLPGNAPLVQLPVVSHELPGPPPIKFQDAISQSNVALAGTLNDLEYRTFLQLSVEFQKALREDMNSGRLNQQVGNELLLLDYPKYIWITEVSSSTLLNHSASQDRKCVGRIISDSTAPAKTRGVIAFHVADTLSLIGRNPGNVTIPSFHPDSTPFGHKVLKQN